MTTNSICNSISMSTGQFDVEPCVEEFFLMYFTLNSKLKSHSVDRFNSEKNEIIFS